MDMDISPEKPPLVWGIMGAGRVCHDFVQALKSIPHAAKVQTVGCRDLDRSNEFGDLHGIPNRVGSYEDVAKDPDVEICYIGMLHPFHYENAKAALLNGKHVLVEKPSTCRESDTLSLVRLAEEKDLFLLEGVWTRFFPAVEKARELIDAGVIGDVVEVHSDFGINGVDLGKYPDDILYEPKLGGGALWYVAPYPVSAAIGYLGRGPPSRIAAAGVMDKLTGVNLSFSISLHFKGKGIACLAGSLQAESAEETTIIGTNGRIKILPPAHAPITLELSLRTGGRGLVETTMYEFPLPTPPASVEATGGFNYPNSNGFQYEAAAVHKSIREGRKSCDECTHLESIAIMHVIEESHKQIKESNS